MQNNNKKQALTKIAKATTSLLPVFGNMIVSISDIIAGIADLYEINQQNKISKLFNDWLNESNELNDEEIQQIIEGDDFYLIIKKVLEEDDDDKIVYYARLLKNSSTSDYIKNNKKEIIFLLYRLTKKEIELAKEFYISSKDKTFYTEHLNEKLQKSYLDKDYFFRFSLNNLKNYGLLDTQLTYGAGEIYSPTKLLVELVETIFSLPELDLQPIS